MTAILLVPVGIALLNVYALALVLARGPLFGTRVYRPMVLNIGLSVAPAVVLLLGVLATVVLLRTAPSTAGLWTVVALTAVVWLVMLPNAGYLVTELNLSHRRRDDPVPLWYDIVLVLSLALSGVLNMLGGVVLVQLMYVLVARPNATDPYAAPDSWIAVAVTLVLVSVGIYLGRSVRFNSWDLLHPTAFARRLVDHLRVPGRWRTVAGFVTVHTVLFALLYAVVVAPVLLVVATAATGG